MYNVTVETDGSTFFAVVENKRVDYRFVGETFPYGRVVDGRYEGERAAFEDATDWRVKLSAAGLKVE